MLAQQCVANSASCNPGMRLLQQSMVSEHCECRWSLKKNLPDLLVRICRRLIVTGILYKDLTMGTEHVLSPHSETDRSILTGIPYKQFVGAASCRSYEIVPAFGLLPLRQPVEQHRDSLRLLIQGSQVGDFIERVTTRPHQADTVHRHLNVIGDE